MRLLIIEDSDTKLSSIISALLDMPGGTDWKPVVVKNLSDAVRSVSTIQFDLIVLDLMIPYLNGTPPSSDAGYELLRQMRSSGPNRHTRVVSISAHPEEVDSYRARFDEMAVLITRYDEEGSWIRTLREVVLASDAANQVEELEFLIVCALDEERNGFDQSDLAPISDASVRGLNVRFVRHGRYTGGIVKTSQMGLVTATHECALALQVFNPRIFCMAGICAGFSSKTTLGQIVCASLAWEYQAGKWSKDGFEIAPLQVPMPSKTRAIIDHLFDGEGFAESLDFAAGSAAARPTRIVKPIIAPMASGSAVIADQKRLSHVSVQHRKVAALDMETFGAFYAAHESRGRLEHFFSMKTVVDLADEQKGDELHEYGCRVSATAAVRALVRMLA